jgi:hypothetical protein
MEPQDERVHGVTPGLSRDYATRTSNRQASFVEHEIGQLEALAASSGLFTYYQELRTYCYEHQIDKIPALLAAKNSLTARYLS